MWRNKGFTIISVLGLALGMACCLFILFWVQDEILHDRQYDNSDRLYRVMENQHYSGNQIFTVQATPGLLAEALNKEVPEIENAVNVTWGGDYELIRVNDKTDKERGLYAGANFFKVFSIKLISGSAETALTSPTSIVISEKIAKKYFGSENPIGKTVQFNDTLSLQVTAVVKDAAKTSSLKFDFIAPVIIYERSNTWLKHWSNNGIRTFVVLKENASVDKVQVKIKNFLRTKQKDITTDLFLQSFGDSYLHGRFENGVSTGGRIEYVRLFSVVAVFILLIACINFMNLATARSARRAKEVGIRKVVGAPRQFLIGQFMGEAIMISLVSILLSLGVVQLLLPVFNSVTGKEIVIEYTNLLFWVYLVGLAILTGVLSGSYPALFLSSLKPVVVLKGVLKFDSKSIIFRKGLVVFQFCLSILLIVGTIVVYRQVNFIKSKNLGFNKENLILLTLDGDLRKNYEVFKQDILQTSSIKAVTQSTTNPIEIGNNTEDVTWPGKQSDEKILFTNLFIGHDFVKTMGVTIKEGRDFSSARVSDTAGFIINEETVRRMKLTKNAVGTVITMWDIKGPIIGVVKDFHINSLHSAIEPLIMVLRPEWGKVALVRTEAGKTQEAIAALSTAFKKYNPKYPFKYEFEDENYRQLYKNEMMVGQLANYFAVLGIFISCLGLFGLAMFIAEQRTKEIGVRKVLGASVTNIVGMLSKDFLKLVMIAAIIAFPLAWFAMNKWLQNFAYRVELSWWIFLIAGFTAMLIALITVSFQAIKAAVANPVKSLRNQ
ncbi:Macrolide export ATP-binding/permease protein MacB [compost metagenome]